MNITTDTNKLLEEFVRLDNIGDKEIQSEELKVFFTAFDNLVRMNKVKKGVDYDFDKDNIFFNMVTIIISLRAFLTLDLDIPTIIEKLQYEGTIPPKSYRFVHGIKTASPFPFKRLPRFLQKRLGVTPEIVTLVDPTKQETTEKTSEEQIFQLKSEAADRSTILELARVTRLLALKRLLKEVQIADVTGLVSIANAMTKQLQDIEGTLPEDKDNVGAGISEKQSEIMAKRRKK